MSTSPPTTSAKPGWRRIRALIGDRLSLVALLAVSSILSAFAEAGILAITAQAATNLVSGHRVIHHSLGPIKIDASISDLLLVGLGLALARLVLQLGTSYYPALIASHVQADMRRNLFAAYTRASWSEKSQDREGYFQEMMTNQVAQASMGALQTTILVTSFFTFVVLALSAFALSVVAAVAVLGASVVLFALLRPVTRLGSRFSRRLSAAQIAYAGAVNEANSIAEEMQVFGVASAQRDRLNAFIAAARTLYFRTQLLARLIPNTYQSVVYLVLIAGLLVINGANVGGFSSLGAVVLLLIRASTYGQQLQTSNQLVRQALPYVERVQEATERYAASEEPPGELPMERLDALELDHVHFSYPAERKTLSDISFSVSAGETIGVVGPSGAGKSTLVQLLLRLRPPSEGTYELNGRLASEYEDRDWSDRVSYVPQQPRLVYASVADNVRLFREGIDDDAVKRACQLARIHDEIVDWADGYDTIIGPRARAISGGQQQRICLARALVGNPEVLVLDEPTSALDPRSEALIQESLTAVQRTLTMFVIAHRMSTLSICDRVLVIVDGRVEAFDTLDELRRSNAYYRLASSLAATAPLAQGSAGAEPLDS